MVVKFLKHLFSVIVFMHCIGLTQLCSACVKNNSAFISMIDMSEEETKTEKECKEECDSAPNIYSKGYFFTSELIYTGRHTYYTNPLHRVGYQFVIESPTPPPDFTC